MELLSFTEKSGFNKGVLLVDRYAINLTFFRFWKADSGEAEMSRPNDQKPI